MRAFNKVSFLLFLTLVLTAALLIIGCAAKEDNGNEEEDDFTERSTAFEISGVTDDDGAATVSFNVAEGTTKFSVTAIIPDSNYIRFLELKSAAGVDYLSPDRSDVSFASSFFPYVNSATVPSRAADAPVDDTERFVAVAQVSASSNDQRSTETGETVRFAINSKADPDLSSGRLRVNLFYVGDVGADQTTRDVIRNALDGFRGIYGGPAHITLDVGEYDIDGPVVIPSPLDGSSFYQTAAAGVPSPALNLFVAGDISGLGSGGDTLGLAAGIPGPPIPSPRSAVAVSIFAGAGPDGVYSAEDVRILGETLAHESGHYIGLFHPVDFSGNTVASTDPLDDTPSCSFITECVGDPALTDNLMFPSPVPNGQGGYRPQTLLTEQQRGVMNRYIVVD